jgi:hypothetical protein
MPQEHLKKCIAKTYDISRKLFFINSLYIDYLSGEDQILFNTKLTCFCCFTLSATISSKSFSKGSCYVNLLGEIINEGKSGD